MRVNIKKTYLLLLLLSILFVSCEEDNLYYGDFDDFILEDYLAFKEEVTIIEVDENVKSFRLSGVIYGDYIFGKEAMYVFSIYPYVTTAKHGEKDKLGTHFFNDIDGIPLKGEGAEWYFDVDIFPEKITSEIQIGYHIIGVHPDYNIGINETIIKLIPKNNDNEEK